jgi:CBS domain-containing protein
MTTQPFTVDRHASLGKAHQIMRENGIRHLPVLQDGKLVGVVSRNDLHLLETVADFPLESVDVEEAMTEPHAVTPDISVDTVVETMMVHHRDCAIVTEGARVIGIFTTVDALRLLLGRLRS